MPRTRRPIKREPRLPWNRNEFFVAEHDGRVYRRLLYPSGLVNVQPAPEAEAAAYLASLNKA
jgi:hypothetical protein